MGSQCESCDLLGYPCVDHAPRPQRSIYGSPCSDECCTSLGCGRVNHHDSDDYPYHRGSNGEYVRGWLCQKPTTPDTLYGPRCMSPEGHKGACSS